MCNIFNKKNDYTIIVGCGNLGVNLATEIYESDNDVLVIDSDENAIKNLPSNYGGLAIISDGTDIDTLKEANIEKATSVIAVTNDDNVNIMVSLLAREIFKIKNVIARLDNPDRKCIYEEFNIETICPTELSSFAINDMLKATYLKEVK